MRASRWSSRPTARVTSTGSPPSPSSPPGGSATRCGLLADGPKDFFKSQEGLFDQDMVTSRQPPSVVACYLLSSSLKRKGKTALCVCVWQGPITRIASGCTQEDQKRVAAETARLDEGRGQFRTHFTPDYSVRLLVRSQETKERLWERTLDYKR